MDEEQIIKLLVFTIKNRINYLERKYAGALESPVALPEIPAGEVAALRDCLHWLFDEARERHMTLDFRT